MPMFYRTGSQWVSLTSSGLDVSRRLLKDYWCNDIVGGFVTGVPPEKCFEVVLTGRMGSVRSGVKIEKFTMCDHFLSVWKWSRKMLICTICFCFFLCWYECREIRRSLPLFPNGEVCITTVAPLPLLICYWTQTVIILPVRFYKLRGLVFLLNHVGLSPIFSSRSNWEKKGEI